MSISCFDHSGFTPGCRACGDADSRYGRQRRGVLPSTPLRTEADDKFVARLVVDLTQRGLEREIRVSRLAEWCTYRLNEHVR